MAASSAPSSKLVVEYSRRPARTGAWPIVALLLAFAFVSYKFYQKGEYIFAPFVGLALIGVTADTVSTLKGKRPRLLTIDDEGLRVILPRGYGICSWGEIESCACLNEGAQRTLRVFVRQLPGGGPRIRLKALKPVETATGLYFDIDFRVTEHPEQSLETAYRACIQKIAAKSGAVATARPIREGADRES